MCFAVMINVMNLLNGLMQFLLCYDSPWWTQGFSLGDQTRTFSCTTAVNSNSPAQCSSTRQRGGHHHGGWSSGVRDDRCLVTSVWKCRQEGHQWINKSCQSAQAARGKAAVDSLTARLIAPTNSTLKSVIKTVHRRGSHSRPVNTGRLWSDILTDQEWTVISF